MVKVSYAVARHRRKKRLLKQAKGYWGARSRRFRQAKQTVMKALAYSYRDRKKKKHHYRSLWIARINSACRKYNLSYNRFIRGLKKSQIALDRKMLADLAVTDEEVFQRLVKIVQDKEAKAG